MELEVAPVVRGGLDCVALTKYAGNYCHKSTLPKVKKNKK
jgi:hypothetical protein